MRLNEFLPAFFRVSRRLWPALVVMALALALPLAGAVILPAEPPPAWAQGATPTPTDAATPTPVPVDGATPTPMPTDAATPPPTETDGATPTPPSPPVDGATPTPMPTDAAAATPTPTPPPPVDYDADDDLLIEVSSLAQLDAIRYELNGDGWPDWPGDTNYAAAFPNPAANMGCPATCQGYELAANLTFDTNGDAVVDGADGPLAWNDGAGWTPIGSTTAPFSGQFQGNDYTISRLFIDNRDLWEVGLFGVNSGEIRQVALTEVRVSGVVADKYIGGLAGSNNRGAVYDSYVTGQVTADGNNPAVGGLVGYNNRGAIYRSYTDAAVTSAGYKTRIGGLVGENNRGTIAQSYARGEVSVANRASGAGGLVGYNNRGVILTSSASGDVSGGRAGENFRMGGLVGKSIYGLIAETYATGAVTGEGGSVVAGGLAGSVDWAILRACYASGAVAAIGSDQATVGGLVGAYRGRGGGDGFIEACYARGPVSHAAPAAAIAGAGGLIGVFSGGDDDDASNSSGDDSIVRNSYWDTETSGQADSAAGTGKTSAELTEPGDYTGIYGDWNLHLDADGIVDFPWHFGATDEYPELRNAYPLNPDAADPGGGPA